MSWDNVVENIWKDIGRNQEEILSIEKLAGYKTYLKARIEIWERLALGNTAKDEEHLEIYEGVKGGRDRNENVFARPNGLRKNAETAISGRGPRPAREKKEVYQ